MNPTLLGFVRKELLQALRDPRMRVVLFVLPIVQMTVFGLAISTEIRGIRLAARLGPNDFLARRLVERCLASRWFVPARVSGEDPLHWVRSGQADAVMLVPSGGLQRSLGRGKGEIQLLVDATNAVRARGVERYFQQVLDQVLREEGRVGQAPPLEFQLRVLYNPSMETAVFMVPGVMCLILGVLTVILSSMAMARERELGTFETLISAPVKNWEILAGKMLPYVLLAMVDVPLTLSVAVFVFGVPMRGSLIVLGFSALVFVCTTVSIGTLLSTFARNQQQAMMAGFLFLYPSILLSGLMFPIENMPALLKGFAYLDPLKYFVSIMRNLMLKGGDWEVLGTNLGALAAMAALSVWVTFRRFHQTLN